MAENPVQPPPEQIAVNSIDHRAGDLSQCAPITSGIDTVLSKNFQMPKNMEGSQPVPGHGMGMDRMQTLNPPLVRPAAKKSSFQITRVITKTAASDNALDDVDTDELDETNTEDVSSDILDVSKTTESGIIEPDQSSEDTVELVAPEAEDILNSKEVKNNSAMQQQIEDHHQPEERDKVNDVHSRFKVVKIESKEPFRRGRWICLDFLDPPLTEKSSDENIIGSGNSSASSSVHFIPGVDDPSKNPLNNVLEDYPIVEPQPVYPGNYQPQSQHMTNGTPSEFSTNVSQPGTQQLPPQQNTTQRGQHQGAHQSATQLGSHVPTSLASHPGGSQLVAHQSATNLVGHPSAPNLALYDTGSSLVAGSSQASQSSVPSSDTLPSSVSSTAVQQQSQPSQQPATSLVLSTQTTTTQSSGQIPPPTSLPADLSLQPGTSTYENSQQPVSNASQNVQTVTGTDISAQQSQSQPKSIIQQPSMPNQEFDSYSNGNASQANINASVEAAQSQTNVNQSQSTNAAEIVQTPGQVQVGSSATSNNNSPNNENMHSNEYRGQDRGFANALGLSENLPETLLGLAHHSSGVPPLLEMVSATMQPSATSNNEDESGASTVAIDNKIEQAMDLVKSHLMFAVREEVEVLKEQIKELLEKNNQLEYENNILKAAATPETLAKLQNQPQPPTSTS